MSKRKKKKAPSKKDIKARLEANGNVRDKIVNKGIHPDHFWSLGILVHNLEPGQQSVFLISSANEFIHEHTGVDLIVYYENMGNTCVTPAFSVLPVYNTSTHDGPLVATDITTLKSIQRMHNRHKKYLYISDPSTLMAMKQFYNPEVNYITAGGDYAKIFKRITGVRPLGSIPRFNVTELIKIIGLERKHD